MPNRRNFFILGACFILKPASGITKIAPTEFVACRQKVHNRGKPPESFLTELVTWAKSAPNDIFMANNRHDIYSSIVEELGPWQGLTHRKAVMLEALRVLGGFESSWIWEADVDITNPLSNTPCTAEAGIFQCSADSMSFDPSLKKMLLDTTGKTDCGTFRIEIKKNHRFSIEYCARLIRFTTNHHGPIKNKHINPWLKKDSVEEFMRFLEAT